MHNESVMISADDLAVLAMKKTTQQCTRRGSKELSKYAGCGFWVNSSQPRVGQACARSAILVTATRLLRQSMRTFVVVVVLARSVVAALCYVIVIVVFVAFVD